MNQLSTLGRLAGAALLLAAAHTAHAVALTVPVSPAPFADTALPGTTSAARPELAGVVLQDVLTPFSFSGISGTVQNRVVRENGTGTLDFYWKVIVDSSDSGSAVTAFRLANFGVANITDADWRIDSLGTQAPDTGRLFNVANYPAGDINFLFGNAPVAAGTSSHLFFLHTNATDYAQTALYDMLNTGDALSSSYSTFAPVPEPSSLALAVGGLALIARVARRRS